MVGSDGPFMHSSEDLLLFIISAVARGGKDWCDTANILLASVEDGGVGGVDGDDCAFGRRGKLLGIKTTYCRRVRWMRQYTLTRVRTTVER